MLKIRNYGYVLTLLIVLIAMLIVWVFIYYNQRINDIENNIKQTSISDLNK